MSGSASLLAGLTSDIRNITIAFVMRSRLSWCRHYPHRRLGGVSGDAIDKNAAGCCHLDGGHYLGRICAGGAGLPAHMAHLRETEDKLYNDYQTVLKDAALTLNRERAEQIFQQCYIPDAKEYRHHIIRADTFHLSAVNWSNIMMLGAIGPVFWMANSPAGRIPTSRRPIH